MPRLNVLGFFFLFVALLVIAFTPFILEKASVAPAIQMTLTPGTPPPQTTTTSEIPTPVPTDYPGPPTPTPTPPPEELGDVNGDGQVTIVDALLIAQFSVGLILDGNFNPLEADVNSDGQITIEDALLVAQILVGLI